MMGILSIKGNIEKQPLAHVVQNRCSLKLRNIHRKTTMLESRSDKVAGLEACNLNKKRFRHWCFPVNTAKFLGTVFLQNTSCGCI